MPSVLVIGGGLSGLSAAHTCLMGGAQVTLLDKNPFLGGNSTKATSGINGAGSRTQDARGVSDNVETFLEDMVRSATGVKTGPCPEPYPIARTLAEASAPAVHWIQDNFGLALDTVSRLGGHTNKRTHRSGNAGKFPGFEITDALMRKYEEICDNGGAELIINARVNKLIVDNGRVAGVVYDDGEGNLLEAHADAVILATGGYAAGYESVLKDVRPDLLHLPTTNGDHSQGDGIRVAMDIGARATGLKHVQVHPTGAVNPDDPDAKTKFLFAEALRGEGGILLTRDGDRFCNDLGKRDYVTGMMWKTDKAPYRLVLNSKASSGIEWHCKHYVARRVMKHYATGHELAKDMGITSEKLQASFQEYNACAKAGKDPFEKKFFANTPFDINDSFYVGIATPVIHYTMGGLSVTPDMECISEESRVIPGLYAAGEITGGVHGRNRLGGSGLLECVAFGRISGASALAYVNNMPLPVTTGQAGNGVTTTITIPQSNGADPITIVTSGGAPKSEYVGKEVVIDEPWVDEVTTEVGKLTAGADGAEGIAQPTAEPAAAADAVVVFGSFFMGDSRRDAATIVKAFPADAGFDAPKAIEGNDFDFNSLAKTKFLVIATSSMYGNPPKNFWKFYYQLKAASQNPNKPLKGLQHAVYGNGDETYIDTYMNVPRVIDLLLERAGSRRFFARGETSEPHAPTGAASCNPDVWAPAVWEAAKTADASAPPVAWDAHWEGTGPLHHDKVTDWPLEKIEKKFGAPETLSIFATPAAKL